MSEGRTIEACRVCDSSSLEVVLDLGKQPWGNHFLPKEQVGTEPKYPLRLAYCGDCSVAQLDFTVPKEVMFGHHTYMSGTTKTLRDHFRTTARQIHDDFFEGKPKKSALDIGSNDGSQLVYYKELGFDVVGVECCPEIARFANTNYIPTISAFFNQDTAKEIMRDRSGNGNKNGFDIINASGVFFHLEELHSATEGIRECLDKNGVFVAQFLYMKDIMANGAFDQIYHEHLLYYNIRTVERLLNRHGLSGFHAYRSPIHGGSIILLAGHDGIRKPTDELKSMVAQEEKEGANTRAHYEKFAELTRKRKEEIVRDLDKFKGAGKKIYGMGAPVKGNTLLNYCGIGTQYLECLVERNNRRQGLFSPGMHIPIRLEDELGELERPDVYFVLAWNFKREILKRYASLAEQGVEFYFPVDPEKTQK